MLIKKLDIYRVKRLRLLFLLAAIVLCLGVMMPASVLAQPAAQDNLETPYQASISATIAERQQQLFSAVIASSHFSERFQATSNE